MPGPTWTPDTDEALSEEEAEHRPDAPEEVERLKVSKSGVAPRQGSDGRDRDQ